MVTTTASTSMCRDAQISETLKASTAIKLMNVPMPSALLSALPSALPCTLPTSFAAAMSAEAAPSLLGGVTLPFRALVNTSEMTAVLILAHTLLPMDSACDCVTAAMSLKKSNTTT